MRLGQLVVRPALEQPDLLAEPVLAGLAGWVHAGTVGVAEIDPELADTAAFCARYGVAAEDSANCVVVAGRRGAATRLAAVVLLANTRADVNDVIRRQLQARKVSFAPMELAVAGTGMQHGGITPIGLPADWPLLVDPAVLGRPRVVVGSGLRRSKLLLPGAHLAALPGARVVAGLARPMSTGS